MLWSAFDEDILVGYLEGAPFREVDQGPADQHEEESGSHQEDGVDAVRALPGSTPEASQDLCCSQSCFCPVLWTRIAFDNEYPVAARDDGNRPVGNRLFPRIDPSLNDGRLSVVDVSPTVFLRVDGVVRFLGMQVDLGQRRPDYLVQVFSVAEFSRRRADAILGLHQEVVAEVFAVECCRRDQ